MVDTVIISNARVATADGELSEATIGIHGGTIDFVQPGGTTPVSARGAGTCQVIDAAGNWVLPGVVDCHAHFGAFLPFEDDLVTETRAAAAGGVTTVFHVILEPGSIVDRLSYYADAVAQRATVDMHFWAACMTEEHLREIPKLRRHGIRGFKFFLAYKGREMEDVGIFGIDYGYLQRGLEQVGACDGVAVVHVENYELLQLHKSRHDSRNDFLSFCRSRPSICEVIDAFAACRLAQETGTALYLAHTGTPEVVEIVRQFKARGGQIHVETSPRYLLIDETGSGLRQPELAITTPSYKPRHLVEQLWDKILDASIDTIATDSAANTLASKLADGTVWRMQPSWQEMPTSLACMVTAGVKSRGMSMSRLADLVSSRPATIFGLYPTKGSLQPGADADLVILDTDTARLVEPCPHSACDYSPYVGWELVGWPVLTMVRGQVVMDRGEILVGPGYGRAVSVTT